MNRSGGAFSHEDSVLYGHYECVNEQVEELIGAEVVLDGTLCSICGEEIVNVGDGQVHVILGEVLENGVAGVPFFAAPLNLVDEERLRAVATNAFIGRILNGTGGVFLCGSMRAGRVSVMLTAWDGHDNEELELWTRGVLAILGL